MKQLLIISAMFLVSLTVTGQAKLPAVTGVKHVADTASYKTIVFKETTQDRFKELRDKIDELQALAKLIKKNQDMLGIVNQRAGLLSEEFKAQVLTLYETNGVDPRLVKRDSVVKETLILYFGTSSITVGGEVEGGRIKKPK